MVNKPLSSQRPKPARNARLAFDADRLRELREELGEDGLVSILSVLARDIASAIAALPATVAADRQGTALKWAAHRWVGTLAQFGLTGHASRILQGCREDRDDASRLCALLFALRHAAGPIKAEVRQLTVNHGGKESPARGMHPQPG